jgi:hypothetical protein
MNIKEERRTKKRTVPSSLTYLKYTCPAEARMARR